MRLGVWPAISDRLLEDFPVKVEPVCFSGASGVIDAPRRLRASLANTQDPEAKAKLTTQIADLQVSLKRYEPAVKTLLQITKLAPHSPQAPQAMLRAGQLAHGQLGDPDLAKIILDGLFLSYPDSTAAESALELAEQINPGD